MSSPEEDVKVKSDMLRRFVLARHHKPEMTNGLSSNPRLSQWTKLVLEDSTIQSCDFADIIFNTKLAETPVDEVLFLVVEK